MSSISENKPVKMLMSEIDGISKIDFQAGHQLELLLKAHKKGLPLRYLRDCAPIENEYRFTIPAAHLPLRRGRYPHYLNGFDVAPIDDFNTEGRRLLVVAKGAVSTHLGMLTVIRADGRFSASSQFHIVNPRPEDYGYLSVMLSALPASRMTKGTKMARYIDERDLKTAIIPWPELPIRRLFLEALKKCGDYSNELKSHVLEYWMHAVKNRENLVKGPAGVTSTRTHNHPTNTDHSADVLTIAEGVIDILAPNQGDIFDVVANTVALGKRETSATYDMCVCFSPPNQGRWTQSAVDSSDTRWVFGPPPRNKANYAWIQQTIAHLSDKGRALLLLCNAPLHSEIGREKQLRETFAQSNLIDAVIALPGGLFGDGRPPVSLIVLDKARVKGASTLFIDLQETGESIGLTPEGTPIRTLPHKDILQTVELYGAWRKGLPVTNSFAQVAAQEEIVKQNYLLTPWTYLEN